MYRLGGEVVPQSSTPSPRSLPGYGYPSTHVGQPDKITPLAEFIGGYKDKLLAAMKATADAFKNGQA